MKCSLQGWLIPTSIDHQGPEIHLILPGGQLFSGGTRMIWLVEDHLEVVLNLIIDKGSQVGAAAHWLSPRQCLASQQSN